MKLISALLADQRGATGIEYGLVMVLVTFGILSATEGIGEHVFKHLTSAMAGFQQPAG